MTITNNRTTPVSVSINIGNKVVMEKLAPREVKSVSYLTTTRQVMNSNLIRSRAISVV